MHMNGKQTPGNKSINEQMEQIFKYMIWKSTPQLGYYLCQCNCHNNISVECLLTWFVAKPSWRKYDRNENQRKLHWYKIES